mmetsp:Transcript_33678/g.52034  ORF Transcript_33678/g.52034 Transcript_33678/m.52034 type:complete len:110 (-) Transcript_33678:550-879(-)
MVSGKLEKIKEEHKSRKRCLSSHVSSRWYRAPEICLLEKHYDQASDLWAIGCILYEMLRVSLDNCEDPFDRILFPGECCYPLSPVEDAKRKGDEDVVFDSHDQMRHIVK